MSSEEIHFSVVIPVYNSARILPELHRRLTEVMSAMGRSYEIVLVEDCGPDNAWEVLRDIAAADSHVRAIQLMRNSGQGNATVCGLAHARGQLVINMDDDLQHLPEEIPSLVAALTPDLDIVLGVPETTRHNLFRRLVSQAAHKLNSILLDKDPNIRFTAFRCMRRPVVDAVLGVRTFAPSFGPMLNTVTRRIGNVTLPHAPRKEGRSGYNLKRLFEHAVTNFVGYSMMPLRLLALAGLAGILVSILLGAYLFLRHLAGTAVSGWIAVALLLVLLSGCMFLALAFLGEHVFRILQQADATPRYTVRQIASRAGSGDEDTVGIPAHRAGGDDAQGLADPVVPDAEPDGYPGMAIATHGQVPAQPAQDHEQREGRPAGQEHDRVGLAGMVCQDSRPDHAG